MEITATEAKNRLGFYLSQIEREPVHILKNDRVAAVIISPARYAELEALERKKSLTQRRKEFNEKYRHWIAAQNTHVEQNGLWCDGLVPWMEKG